jgi:NAD-dependent DNA ligase
MSYSQYITLCLELIKHCYLYYQLNQPTMQDYEYDKKYRQLVDYEEERSYLPNTFKPPSFSPTQFVDFDEKFLSYGGTV